MDREDFDEIDELFFQLLEYIHERALPLLTHHASQRGLTLLIHQDLGHEE
jgi:hypothetical protein